MNGSESIGPCAQYLGYPNLLANTGPFASKLPLRNKEPITSVPEFHWLVVMVSNKMIVPFC